MTNARSLRSRPADARQNIRKCAAKPETAGTDPRARQPRAAARQGRGKTYGGVDYYGSSKAELYERAKKLDVPGRSRMSKDELAGAVARRQKSASAAKRH